MSDVGCISMYLGEELCKMTSFDVDPLNSILNAP